MKALKIIKIKTKFNNLNFIFKVIQGRKIGKINYEILNVSK